MYKTTNRHRSDIALVGRHVFRLLQRLERHD